MNVFKKHTKYDLFVCGDTLSLMAYVYSLRRLFMNYNESTHQEYVLAGSDYNHLFGFYFTSSHFASSCVELSFLSPNIALVLL